VHEEGIAGCPGLYFAGLGFASTRKSGTLLSLAEEAPRLINHILTRQ
jgi:putative flavoprotein involved in K+ transport